MSFYKRGQREHQRAFACPPGAKNESIKFEREREKCFLKSHLSVI